MAVRTMSANKMAMGLVGVMLLLGGCARNGALSTTQSISPVEQMPQRFAAWTDAVTEYQFAPGDKIKVQFLLTPELTEDAVVGPDGMIGVRAAGHVLAAGKTASQLQKDIAAASAGMLTSPIVTVSLVETPGAQVFVGGSVGKAGAYTITGRRGSFEAIELAGGFDPEARMDEVVLIRRDPQNRPMLRTVDLRGVIEGTNEGTNVHPDVPLMAGDIVFVPRNKISEVDLWIDQYITRLLPFSRSFDYSINRTGQPF
jgi:protein involved in polysaccharide export with SLBB domain